MPRIARRVDVYQDDAGKWRWRQRASNGLTTADSGQSYYDKRSAISAAINTFHASTPVKLRVLEIDGTVTDCAPIR